MIKVTGVFAKFDEGSFNQTEDPLFKEALDDPNLQREYGFGDVHGDREEYYDMQGDKYLRCRHFGDMNSPLIRKILDADNIVGGCVIDTAMLTNNSLGFIITADAIRKLGYSTDSIPSYIYYKAYNQSADTLGFQLLEDNYSSGAFIGNIPEIRNNTKNWKIYY